MKAHKSTGTMNHIMLYSVPSICRTKENYVRRNPEIKSGRYASILLVINSEELVFSGSPLTSGVAASQTDCFPSRFTGFL